MVSFRYLWVSVLGNLEKKRPIRRRSWVFATAAAAHLEKSALPHEFVIGYAYAIPFLEAALGVVLIFGLLTRTALVCGAVFMIGLTIGVTSNQQWVVAGQQLLYSLVFFVLLYLVELNAYSLDAVLKRSSNRNPSHPLAPRHQ